MACDGEAYELASFDVTIDGNIAKGIASTTIILAHSLGLRVIAEGVETQEQLAALKRLKCDEVQGYFFSKPVPRDQIDAMLKRSS